MDDSTIADGRVASATEAYVFDLGSLYDRFEQLPDARKARGKRYALALILSIMVLAKLSGEDTPYGIAEWARLRQDDLLKLFAVERPRLPGHNTYRRVAGGAVAPNALQQETSAFLTGRPGAGRSVLVSIDGKTLRGTIWLKDSTGVHLLAAYLPHEGVVLMQVLVEHHENEITAAPKVLTCLDLRDKIVMGDAMHTQRELSIQILDAGGDYLWYVKNNQPTLRKDIEQHFQPEVCGAGSSPVPTDFASDRHSDKGHGRLEVRKITTSALLNEYLDWPGVGQVFKLERWVNTMQNQPLRYEVVYGLTSLTRTEASPARLLQLTRDYWGIENGLHYRRDVTLKEDALRTRSPRLAEVWAIINNLVIGLVSQLGFDNLAQARRCFAANLSSAAALVLRSP